MFLDLSELQAWPLYALRVEDYRLIYCHSVGNLDSSGTKKINKNKLGSEKKKKKQNKTKQNKNQKTKKLKIEFSTWSLD